MNFNRLKTKNKFISKTLFKFGIPRLESIFISPSHECNANCVHCYEKFKNKQGSSLSSNEVKRIIDEFKYLGGRQVYFCSGEFLLRQDAFDLIKYAKSNNMQVSLTTNGLLVDENIVKSLKLAGLSHGVVSIDSTNSVKHDELRGVKGCFDKAVSALKLFKESGILTSIWTYITKSNIKELEGISELGRKLDVD